MAFTPYRDRQTQAAADAEALVNAAAALMSDLPEAVMLSTGDGHLLWGNEAAGRIFFGRGITRGTLLSEALHGQVLSGLLSGCEGGNRPATGKIRINELRNGEVEAVDWAVLVTSLSAARTPADPARVYRLIIRELPLEPNPEGDPCRRALREARSPLSVIAGYAENLAQGEISDPASARQAMLALVRQTRRLQHILESVPC